MTFGLLLSEFGRRSEGQAVRTRTTTQLLDSLRDASDETSWRTFDERYRPVIRAFARRAGLDEDASQDVAQATLAQFSADYRAGRYDRDRGRLSAWLLGIARHRIADAGREKKKRRGARGESGFVEVGADACDEAAWEAARQKVVLERALTLLREGTRMDERTLRAFDLCAMRNVPAEEAAAACGMSVAEVYVAKNRAIKKLREIVAGLTEEFEGE